MCWGVAFRTRPRNKHRFVPFFDTLEERVVPIFSNVSFAASSFYANVTAADATIDVVLSWDAPAGTAAVNYATSDGTATAGTNYDSASGTLNFSPSGPGDYLQTFSVPIIDLSSGIGATVNLTLSSPVNISLGTSTATLTIEGPAVTGVSPAAGPLAGGTSVTISGSDFTGASAVDFGATAATSFTVDSDTQITATAPAGSAGSDDITVTSSAGTSNTTGSDQFAYVDVPTVTAISPAAGPTSGGTVVTITGTNFSYVSEVDFDGTSATYSVDSSTQITAFAPAESAGTVDITVTTAGGISTTSGSDEFIFLDAPTVTAVSPAAGSTSGGTSVTITGTGFSYVSAVEFEGTPATSYTVDSSTQITATAPAESADTVDVTVTTAGGISTTSGSDEFTYLDVPTVTGISPAAGTTDGGTSVTITGTNFSYVSAVDFGGTAATSYTIDSSTEITATSPAESINTVDITVTTAGGTSATSSNDQFTYVVVSLANPGTETNADGDTILLPVSASDSAGNVIAYSASGLPSGLSIDSSTGIISGTISGGDDAYSPYTVNITAADSVGSDASASQSFEWTVNPTGTITVSLTSPGDQTNLEEDSVDLSLSATDSASNALVYGAVNLPPGLVIDPSTGVISGNIWDGASASSPYTVILSASDSTNPDIGASQSITWTVNPLVTLVSPGDQSNADGDTVYLPLAVMDSAGNAVNFSATNLPSGLSIDSTTGIISGTISGGADAYSPYSVTVIATDSVDSSGTASQNLTWTVASSGSVTVTLTQPADQTNLEEDTVAGLSLSATDSASNSMVYGAANLPPGLTIDSSTGVIAGTVDDADYFDSPYSVTVRRKRQRQPQRRG